MNHGRNTAGESGPDGMDVAGTNMDMTIIDTPAKASAPDQPAGAVPGRGARAPLLDQLLLAVAKALNALLGAGELRDSIGQALQLLGEAAQMHRVKVILDQPEQAGQAACHTLAYEWCAPGFVSQASLGVVTFPNVAMSEYLAPLQSGQSFWQWIDEVPDHLRDAFELVGMRSMGVVPIFAKDRYAGLVAFDDCVERRHWSEAEIEALTIAARAIGAVIEREAAESQRTLESSRLQLLLQAVNEASRCLVEEHDLGTGLQRALAALYRLSGVDRVFINRYEAEERATYFLLEHKRDDLPSIPDCYGLGPWQDDRLVQVIFPLRAGRVYQSIANQRRNDTGESNFGDDLLSDLIVPILVRGRRWGCIGFDDSTQPRRWSTAEVSVLQTAASAIAAAIVRQDAESARLKAEQARADQAETDSCALREREGLLQTVTEATRALLAGSDFDTSVGAGMALLGTALGVIRVGMFQDLPLSLDDEPGRWRMTHEWTAAGVPAQIGAPADTGVYPSREAWQRLRSGDAVVVHVDESELAFARGQRSIRTVSILAVPLFVSGCWWGLMAFDKAQVHVWAAHELAVLKTAAACVGAALERQQLETRRLALERVRTDEALSLNRLLEGVVAASRALLEAPDFQAGLYRWLAFLAQAVDADRAIYGSLVPPNDPKVIAQASADWVRAGIASAAGLEVPASQDFIEWAGRLQRGEIVWAHRENLIDPISLRFWEVIECQTNLIVPVVLDACSIGFLAFDWVTRREWQPAYASVLRTAADGLAAAIKRQEALDALLAERERSANERTVELAQANASMRRTLARLAAAEDVDAFLATALLELRQQAGAEEAFLFAADEGSGDKLLRLRGSVRADGFQRKSAAGDPPIFASGFFPTPQSMVAMQHGSWLLWRPVAMEHRAAGAAVEDGLAPRQPQVQHWLQQRGIAADACCLLQVGERSVGLVVLHLTSVQPLPSSRCELLVALSQPMALALELGRMGRSQRQAAEDSAVLAERNRMARDVHDTLAQGFTAISLQLQAAARADSADDRARFVARATQEAQANLVESRRTIRMLRGLDEPDGATYTVVHLIEDALASRLSGTPLAWRVSPLPAGGPEPKLNEESRRELKRIAQEAATNALKHAGATVFDARLSLLADGALRVRFEDQGCGFDTEAVRDGFGILGMRERAERIGAAFSVESRQGGPTAVVVLVPPLAQPGASS